MQNRAGVTILLEARWRIGRWPPSTTHNLVVGWLALMLLDGLSRQAALRKLRRLRIPHRTLWRRRI
jgi:hypothetical protein